MTYIRYALPRLLAPLLMTLLVAACAAPSAPVHPPPWANEGNFDAAWQAYVQQKRAFGLQPGCEPLRIDHAPETRYRGTVVWLHGFSACPRQFSQLAPLLSQHGFRTLVMLLPGNGLAPRDDKNRPYIDDLPTPDDWKWHYRQLAQEVNAMMVLVEGERVIGGLSVGATAALYVQLQKPGLYDKQITLTPYFGVAAGRLSRTLISIGSQIPLVRELPIQWLIDQNDCLREQRQGRAGFCRYRLEHIGALLELGSATLEALEGHSSTAALQLLGKHNDDVANNAMTLRFIELYSDAKIHVCFFPQAVPHALVSLWSQGEAPPGWRSALYDGIANFLVSGEPYPVSGTVAISEKAFPRCQL